MPALPRHTLKLLAIAASLAACGDDSADVAGADNAACPSIGEYDFVCGPLNAEDLVRVPDTDWVIASSMAPGAPIYLIDAQTRQATNLYPSTTSATNLDADTFQACPGEPDTSALITHGLHLRQHDDRSMTLYAVAHGARETVEVFDVDMSSGTPALTWTGCVFMPEGLEANSVTSAADGSLFATVLIHPEYTFEDSVAGRPTGALYEWSPRGDDFERIDGTELASTNGIEISADGTEIFTASSGLRSIVAYDRSNPSRQLRSTATLPIIPDNVHMGENGMLITAGTVVDEAACGGMPEPSEFDIEAYAQCPRGFIAFAVDPQTMQHTVIAEGARNEAFSNATMALQVGDEVWVGTFSGDRIGIVAAE